MPPKSPAKSKSKPSSKSAKPYAMTVVFPAEHVALLDALEAHLLDTRANVVRRALVEMAERYGLRGRP